MVFVSVCKALYDYIPGGKDAKKQLAFSEGDILFVTDKSALDEEGQDNDWWVATNSTLDAIGNIPISYVEELQPIGQGIAMYDYKAEFEDDIDLVEHEPINIIYKLDEDWWIIEKNQQYGQCPACYIEENGASQANIFIRQEVKENLSSININQYPQPMQQQGYGVSRYPPPMQQQEYRVPQYPLPMQQQNYGVPQYSSSIQQQGYGIPQYPLQMQQQVYGVPQYPLPIQQQIYGVSQNDKKEKERIEKEMREKIEQEMREKIEREMNEKNKIKKKKIYMNQIKNLIINTDKSFIPVEEKYIEWKIENWSNFQNEQFIPEFEANGYSWKVLIEKKIEDYNEYIGINLNLCENISKFIWINFVLSIRNYNDFNYIAEEYDDSPIYIKGNKSRGMEIILNKSAIYEINTEFNRPLIENNKAIIGIYIQFYKQN